MMRYFVYSIIDIIFFEKKLMLIIMIKLYSSLFLLSSLFFLESCQLSTKAKKDKKIDVKDLSEAKKSLKFKPEPKDIAFYAAIDSKLKIVDRLSPFLTLDRCKFNEVRLKDIDSVLKKLNQNKLVKSKFNDIALFVKGWDDSVKNANIELQSRAGLVMGLLDCLKSKKYDDAKDMFTIVDSCVDSLSNIAELSKVMCKISSSRHKIVDDLCFYIKGIKDCKDLNLHFFIQKEKELSDIYIGMAINKNVKDIESESEKCCNNIDLAYSLIFGKEFLI